VEAWTVSVTAWFVAGLLAGLGVYLAVSGANPFLTLAAGIGVGIVVAAGRRDRKGDR
jgi:hypothetical protein